MRKNKPLKKVLLDEANASIGEFITIMVCAFIAFALFLAPIPERQRQRQIAPDEQVHANHL